MGPNPKSKAFNPKLCCPVTGNRTQRVPFSVTRSKKKRKLITWTVSCCIRFYRTRLIGVTVYTSVSLDFHENGQESPADSASLIVALQVCHSCPGKALVSSSLPSEFCFLQLLAIGIQSRVNDLFYVRPTHTGSGGLVYRDCNCERCIAAIGVHFGFA